MQKELLVIVYQYRNGELKIQGVLTTRQAEREICAGRALYKNEVCLYLFDKLVYQAKPFV